jgi:hypothetical protein
MTDVLIKRHTARPRDGCRIEDMGNGRRFGKGADDPRPCAKALREFLQRAARDPYIDATIVPRLEPRARPMNAPMEMTSDEVLRVRLEVLRREHRDLDEAVRALEAEGRADPLTLRRLKKRKLALKDMIARIEDRLIPDIIA